MELTKGLKKGDVFEEAGRFFVIEEEMEDGNYISREIEKPEKEEGTKKRTKRKKAETEEVEKPDQEAEE